MKSFVFAGCVLFHDLGVWWRGVPIGLHALQLLAMPDLLALQMYHIISCISLKSPQIFFGAREKETEFFTTNMLRVKNCKNNAIGRHKDNTLGKRYYKPPGYMNYRSTWGKLGAENPVSIWVLEVVTYPASEPCVLGYLNPSRE